MNGIKYMDGIKDSYKEFKEFNREIKNHDLNDIYRELLNEYEELIENNFSFDDKVSANSLFKLAEEMSPSKRVKFAKTLIKYYQAEIAYKKMNEISKLIDSFMKDDKSLPEYIDSDYIKKEIWNIPESRLVLTNSKEKERIYEEFSKNYYEFALYLSYKGYPFFDKEQIGFIEKYALEDLSNIPINNDMPADLHKAIQESHQKSNYHNRELLKQLYLYKYKNEILVSTYPKDLNTKLNEIVSTQGKIVASKSRIRKFIARTALVTTLTIGTMSVIPAITYAIRDNNPYTKTATISIDDNETTKDVDDLLLYKTILREYYNTTRKYVTVFGDTIDNKVNIKVYDYTNTNYTDEDLKELKLDENNLIFDETILEEEAYRVNLYGKYTGEAHRDIASVEFSKKENNSPAYDALLGFSFMLLLVASAIMLSPVFDNTLSKKLENVIRDIKEEKKSVVDLTQELLKLVEEAEAIEAKYSVDNTTVEEELKSIELSKRV